VTLGQPACHGGHFGREIVLAPFDTLADDIEDEAVHARALRRDERCDRLLVVLHEWLRQQRNLGEELVERTFYHLFDDVGRLARLGGARGRDRALLLDDVGGHLFARDRLRFRCGDVHREVLAERFVATRVIDQHADARAVHIRRDAALRIEPHEAAQRDVLAELLHERRSAGFDRFAGGERAPRKRRDVACALARDELRDLVGERAERVVLRDEVRLAVELDHRGGFRVVRHRDADDAFGRDARGRLARLRAAPDAQQFLGLAEVAARVGQSLLAFHHGEARALAQLHHPAR